MAAQMMLFSNWATIPNKNMVWQRYLITSVAILFAIGID
jgi:hypothetical protein